MGIEMFGSVITWCIGARVHVGTRVSRHLVTAHHVIIEHAEGHCKVIKLHQVVIYNRFSIDVTVHLFAIRWLDVLELCKQEMKLRK